MEKKKLIQKRGPRKSVQSYIVLEPKYKVNAGKNNVAPGEVKAAS
jgi:hypothetical protein